MEKSSSKTKKTSTEVLKITRSHHGRIETKKSDRKGQTNSLAIQTLYSPKKRSSRGKTDSRSFKTKQIHKLPIIQNAYHTRYQVPSPTRILDHFSGSLGRLLAHPSSAKQEAVSRFQVPKPKLSVPRLALRLVRGTEGIHEGDITRSENTGQSRYLVSALSRRPVASCPDKRGMPSSFPKGPVNHKKPRFPDQREKVETYSGSKFRVVGDTMGPSVIYSTSRRNEIQMPSRRPDVNRHFSILLHKNSDEGTRSLQLDRPERPQYATTHVDNENNFKTILNISPGYTHPNSKEFKNASMRLDHCKILPTTTGIPETRSNNTNRCITKRMGFPSKPNLFQRHIRSINGILHQRQGVVDHLVRTHDSVTKEHDNPGTLRQFIRPARTEKGRINDISSLLTSRVNLEESSNFQLEPQGISHCRNIQRSSRSTVQEYFSIHRVDPQTSGFPKGTSVEPTLTSGSLCNETEQQTSGVRFAVSRSNSSSSKRTDNIMGQVGPPLYVPSDNITFEGFEQNDPFLLQKRSSYHTRYAHETVVHDTSTTRSSLNDIGSHSSAVSSGQNSGPAQHYKTSRVAVIKSAYQTKFQSCQRTIDLLATPIRQSSVKDYQIKWGKFHSFLTERKISPTQLSLANVLDFFTYLFTKKNLKPNTVAHYRSALAVPLQLEFQLNLHDPAVSHLIKAMQIERPNTPAKSPAWSLNKVLQHIDSWPTKVPLDCLLQKTAFLLLLATGWRISELHACVRATDFCAISRDLTLSLRPHPSFLAKNECPQKRWSHKQIEALRLPDGSISKLCPVTTLTEYLNRTSRVTKGNLLLNPSNQKSLTKQQLSNQIRKLILKAEPDAPGKAHDIRKYAASCSLAETMDVSGMVNALQWKSPKTFYKFYLSPTAPLTVPVTLPNAQGLKMGEPTSRNQANTSYEEDASDDYQ